MVVHEVALDDAEEERLAEQRRIIWASHTARNTTAPGVSGGVVVNDGRCSGADRHGRGELCGVTVYAVLRTALPLALVFE